MNKSHPGKKGGETVTQEICNDMEMSNIVLKIILNRKPNGKSLQSAERKKRGKTEYPPPQKKRRAVEHVLCFKGDLNEGRARTQVLTLTLEAS